MLTLFTILMALSGCSDSDSSSSADRFFLVFQSQGKQLKLHVLDDDLLHLEWSGPDHVTDPMRPIPVTPSVYKRDYKGPVFFSGGLNGQIETSDLKINVEPSTLNLTVYEKDGADSEPLLALAPMWENGATLGISMDPTGFSHVYGLGEQFLTPGETNGDWVGKRRTPGNPYGNAMVAFNGGSTDGGFNGNAQFPVMYALGDEKNCALYLDQTKALTWDFTGDPWQVVSTGTVMRSYVMAGPDLPDIRRDYMELTGTPPVPPKKMFGLWLSQYGYRNWSQVENNLDNLRQAHFPVDGFVLDLFWYGGIEDASPTSRMGALTWDLNNFPDPYQAVAQLGDQGVGIMVIEESYVCSGLDEYEVLKQKGALVHQTQEGPPVSMSYWWGEGGMLDWTNDDSADFWFDYRRLALITVGVMGHWADLGEPEDFDPDAWYHGLKGLAGNTHADVPYGNLANVRLRYRLSPYVYSLAHQAYLRGDPVFPPLVYHYQDDREARELGDHKMIGPFLLARACAQYAETETDVYLPSGTWINYHTGEWIDSTGEWLLNVPLFLEERYTLPLYARSGAVIPEMLVDENTLNIMGLQRDGTVNHDLAVRIFACEGPTHFSLHEDDGWSNAYQNGQVRTTRIEQSLDGDIARVTIFSGTGDYEGAPAHRNNRLVVFFRSQTVTEVMLNNTPLTRYDTPEAFEAAESGWYLDKPAIVRAKSGSLPINQEKDFTFRLSKNSLES